MSIATAERLDLPLGDAIFTLRAIRLLHRAPIADADLRVEARMIRQRRLTGEEPLRLSAVMISSTIPSAK